MSNEGGPTSLGQKLKRALGSLLMKTKAKTHKLGKNPISLNPKIFTDPEIQGAIEQMKSVHEDSGLNHSHYTHQGHSPRHGSFGRTI